MELLWLEDAFDEDDGKPSAFQMAVQRMHKMSLESLKQASAINWLVLQQLVLLCSVGRHRYPSMCNTELCPFACPGVAAAENTLMHDDGLGKH